MTLAARKTRAVVIAGVHITNHSHYSTDNICTTLFSLHSRRFISFRCAGPPVGPCGAKAVFVQ